MEGAVVVVVGLVGPLGRGREQFFVGVSLANYGSVLCVRWEEEMSVNPEHTMTSSASLSS